MKIATFNINNVNKRLGVLLHWLRVANPDVVCLQELKADNGQFPQAAIAYAGYHAVWHGQRSWNGVAILARDCEPVLTRKELPGDSADEQSRYIEAAVNGVLIASLYAPNGNPQPGPKFDYKIAWTRRLIDHAATLYAAGVPVVLAGDYNIVPTERDIYPTKSYTKNALVQPQSRAAFQRLLDQGWVDAVRKLHPDEPMYTFWDYMRNRWPREAGLRLDHLLLSAAAASRLINAGVDRDTRGMENASDHAPAWIVLRDQAKKQGSSKRAASIQQTTPASPGRRSEEPNSKRPLLVIDGDSFAHRSYHALPKSIQKADGSPAGAILGFANMLLRLYRDERPRAVLVAWDTLDKPTFRHRQFPAYQSGRQFDDALLEQFVDLRHFVSTCGFANARAGGYEADDFLAAAAHAEEKRHGTVLVASGDRDTFQLASERTTILFPMRGGELLRIGPVEVRERYGVEPSQVPDFIALRGDPSDKLPGAAGVGAKGGAELLRKHGSLEAILKTGRFAGQAEQLRLFRAIATMDRKAPLPSLAAQIPTWDKAARLARKWGQNRLGERLEELASENG
jgi:exodeoxyribonuclease-3